MKDFQDLQIWERSHALTLQVYKLSSTFPPEERYGLTSQIRRASASVPMNISEGTGRNSDPDFKRFLVFAMGSASELHYQLILARDLGYISLAQFELHYSELVEIKKMLNSFIQKVSERIKGKK